MNAIDVLVLVAGIPPSTCPLTMAYLILIDLIQIKSLFLFLIIWSKLISLNSLESTDVIR